MSKPRRDISAAEVPGLLDKLNAELDRLGVETQPTVAAKLVELSRRGDAQVLDYYEVVRTDPSLTGRVLRLANCAMFALRQPATRLDRAMIILGLERVRALSLGFYLCKAAAAGTSRELGRRVWGQCVYRACLALCVARARCPGLAPEAFVVGLLMDSGQAIMPRILGDRYAKFWAAYPAPADLLEAEAGVLPFTHADVAAALCRRWKLPPTLTRPITQHHAAPAEESPRDAAGQLHRVAYFVGRVTLEPSTGRPGQRAPMAATAQAQLGLGLGELEAAVKAAGEEYTGAMGCFAGMAEPVPDVDAVNDAVRAQLVEALDDQMQKAMKAETRSMSEKFRVGQHEVELEPGRDPGEVVAYINAADGERLVSCTVNPSRDTTDAIGRMLGLEEAPADEVGELVRVMRLMAA